MLKAMLAGAAALVAVGCLSVPAAPAQASELRSFNGGETSQITHVNIARIKSALRLTPAQLPYWAPVEAALVRIAEEQAARDESAGFVRRISRRVVSIALTAAAVQRLAASAMPLIRMLDDEQKRTAVATAHEMGLGAVVAALN
ncbi:MAG TPA: Spy/CpxP family protein refolding chaperone [Pseudolabrys sp.]|nr:Spy/CpxP family protein refolding chaperone [Pseudolabrys sp.]